MARKKKMKASVLERPQITVYGSVCGASADRSWRVGGCQGENVTVYGEDVHYF
jgi:hypothetical protein